MKVNIVVQHLTEFGASGKTQRFLSARNTRTFSFIFPALTVSSPLPIPSCHRPQSVILLPAHLLDQYNPLLFSTYLSWCSSWSQSHGVAWVGRSTQVPTPQPWTGMLFTGLLLTRSLMPLDILIYSGVGSDVWTSPTELHFLWRTGTDESLRNTELSQEGMLVSPNDHKILCFVFHVSREVVKQNEAPDYAQVQRLMFQPIFLCFTQDQFVSEFLTSI